MSLSQIRVPLNNVQIKSGTGKNGKPYYFFEVLEPVRKFISADSPKIEMALASVSEKNQPVSLDALFVNNNFVIDEESFANK